MKFKLTNDSNKVNGSSLKGYVECSYDLLVDVFGESNFGGDEYKVQKEWVIEFKDGTVATIYDYKQGDCYNGEGNGTHYTKVTTWHIGGFSPKAVDYVTDLIDSKVARLSLV